MKISLSALRIIHLSIAIFIIQLCSFYFSIDGVATSIMSAIVVSQSFVGTLYLKARNRLIGTGLGILFSFIAAFLFPENPFFFIGLSLLWVTTMTVISSFVMSENAYIYQLAGYTYAFISIPVLGDPQRAFHNLIFRATDVTMGMGILVITSLLMFMHYSNFNVNERILSIYRGALLLHKKIARRQEVSLDELKGNFNNVSELIANKTIIKYESAFSLRSANLFDRFSYVALMAFFYANTLRHSLRIGGEISVNIQRDYDNIVTQSVRYKREWGKFRDKAIDRPHRFPEYKSVSQALQRGVRTLLVSGLLFTLWYLSGWDGGSDMTILGIVYIVLLSSFPAPLSAAKEIFNGTIQGAIGAWVYIHFIYGFSYAYTQPAIYFFSQLPFMIYGGRLLVESKTFLIGITFLTQFYFSVQPSNGEPVSFSVFMQSSLGGVAGVGIAGLGLVMLFPESKKIRNRDLIKDAITLILQDFKKESFDLHAQLKSMHDKLRRSAMLIAHTRDDFGVLTDLMSLYIIMCHVKFHRLENTPLVPLIRQLQLWAKDGILHVDPDCAGALQAQIAEESGELKRVSLCILSIIDEIGAVYEE
ncbi:FUSC family protein [Serratia bockelmannii]|uniref:FUSC family protein n=1 Tax=Serratia TaxID=613 RepID=UPI00313BA9DC